MLGVVEPEFDESNGYGNKKEYEPTADGLTARNEGYTHAEWDASAYCAEG